MLRLNHKSLQSSASLARLLTAPLSGIWLFALNRPLATLAIAILVSITTVALLADVIATHHPLTQDTDQHLRPPGADHYFGTDGLGRDIFSRMVHGARVSLSVAFLSVGMATVFGMGIGTLSAYWGGKVDFVVQRVVDVFLGFPFLVLALIAVVALGASPASVSIAIAIALAPQIARLSWASTLTIREEPYVEAATAMGASSFHTVGRHLLPNILPPVLAQVTGYLGVAVVAETTLSFLGLGVPPPFPSWGRMLQEGVRYYFEAAPWATLFPGLALGLTVLSFALLGDAVRDLLDPRRRQSARSKPKP